MPRAYFLLRAVLIGSGAKVHIYETDTKLRIEGLRYSGTKSKEVAQQVSAYQLLAEPLMLNEMIKFWTSIGELVSYKITGRLLMDIPLCHHIRNFLKDHVLLKVR